MPSGRNILHHYWFFSIFLGVLFTENLRIHLSHIESGPNGDVFQTGVAVQNGSDGSEGDVGDFGNHIIKSAVDDLDGRFSPSGVNEQSEVLETFVQRVVVGNDDVHEFTNGGADDVGHHYTDLLSTGSNGHLHVYEDVLEVKLGERGRGGEQETEARAFGDLSITRDLDVVELEVSELRVEQTVLLSLALFLIHGPLDFVHLNIVEALFEYLLRVPGAIRVQVRELVVRRELRYRGIEPTDYASVLGPRFPAGLEVVLQVFEVGSSDLAGVQRVALLRVDVDDAQKVVVGLRNF